MRRHLIAALSVFALALAGCADDPSPEVDGTEPGATEPDVEDEVDEPEPEVEHEAPEEAPEAAPGPDDDAPDEADQPENTDVGGTDESTDVVPDQAQLDDPCADHQDREGDAFLELVAPVDDQVVGEEVELVGCSSVPEGTVQFRVLDGDGRTLDDGFTTAECGGPCIGVFRETIELASADGEPVVYLQVFWEDLADGSDRDLVERIVVIE